MYICVCDIVYIFCRIPTLQELGFSSTETLYSNKGGWTGGETTALKRFVKYCQVRSKPPSDNYVSGNFYTSTFKREGQFGMNPPICGHPLG